MRLHGRRLVCYHLQGVFTLNENKYAAQKKYLNDKRKKLSVWVDSEKYETFKAAVKEDGNSIYGLINAYIDDYLKNRTHLKTPSR